MSRICGAWSRWMMVVAVLMLGRPPCVGATCCSQGHGARRDQAARVAQASAQVKAKKSCCQKDEGPATRETSSHQACGESLPLSDGCQCCRPAPPTSAPKTESSAEEDREQLASADHLLPSNPPQALNPAKALALHASEASPSAGVPIYVRLAHWRN